MFKLKVLADAERVREIVREHPEWVNQHEPLGGTPLHKASFKCYVDTVRVLLDAGADVNALDRNGRTPLHDALEFGNLEVIAALVEAGADPTFKDKNGSTPRSCAKAYGHTAVAEYFDSLQRSKWLERELESVPVSHTSPSL